MMRVPLRGYLVPLLAAAALILTGWHARAKSIEPLDVPCSFVRSAVRAAGGLDNAIREALRRGYDEQYIASTIKRCGLRG